jgi:dihydroorotate dehydrogenase
VAGATIMTVGMTSVFVPQDLAFMQMTSEQISRVSPRLIPIIAHDRAGFGGGLFTTGIVLLLLARHAPLARSLVEITLCMGIAGFGGALGVHFAIGYTDFIHLAPAYLGCALFLATVARLAVEVRAHGKR